MTRQVKLPIDADGYIPRIRFTQDPNKLAIMTLNRHQNRFDMYFADPRSTVCKLALRDESPYYINENVFDNIRFYPDNFSFVSDKSGYPHLYWYSMNGNLIKQVTSGNYEVKSFIGWNPDTNEFYYTSNEESPMRQAVYKIDRKGKKVKLSNQQGTNSPIFSSSMKYFMNKFTSLDTPMLITLNDNTGKVLKTLVTNDKLKEKLAGYAIPQKEFFTFKTTEGVDLNGWMMKPVNFDPSKRYPVLMFQYSGPGSQQVLEKWGISWETYMASLGYVVACVDGRGTGGRGSEFQKCTYLNLGVKEAKDQVEAKVHRYLKPESLLPHLQTGNITILYIPNASCVLRKKMPKATKLPQHSAVQTTCMETCFWYTVWQMTTFTSRTVPNMPNTWYSLENSSTCRYIPTGITAFMAEIPGTICIRG